MNEQVRFRVDEIPKGGGRIAWSYLGALLAGLVATLLWAAWIPFSHTACGPDNPSCELGWGIVGWLGSMTIALLLPTFMLRLGWEWWCVCAAVLLSAPVWADGATGRTICIAIMMPLVSALVTWRGQDRPWWRPVISVGLVVLAVASTTVAVLFF